MKIGLRGGHSKNCIGAVGIVKEYEQMQSFYKYVKEVFEKYGHTVIDCNSNATTPNGELSEGAAKANNNNVDLFISLHMNAFDRSANGTECVISSTSSKSYLYAKNICENFSTLGFKNRGVKTNALYEMKYIKAPNIIFELCFCDSPTDIAIYNKYTWTRLAHTLCNAIDRNIPLDVPTDTTKGYVVTNYLSPAYSGYNGVDIQNYLDLFKGVRTYVRGNNNGVWIETQMLDMNKCMELKNKLGNLFYSIEK